MSKAAPVGGEKVEPASRPLRKRRLQEDLAVSVDDPADCDCPPASDVCILPITASSGRSGPPSSSSSASASPCACSSAPGCMYSFGTDPGSKVPAAAAFSRCKVRLVDRKAIFGRLPPAGGFTFHPLPPPSPLVTATGEAGGVPPSPGACFSPRLLEKMQSFSCGSARGRGLGCRNLSFVLNTPKEMLEESL